MVIEHCESHEGCDLFGLNYHTTHSRIKDFGMSAKEAFERPICPKRAGKMVAHNGKAQNISEWSRELEIPVSTLQARVSRGEFGNAISP